LLLPRDASAQKVTYYHNDILGSPVVATDGAGAVLWKETYRPFGTPHANSSATFGDQIGFSGKAYDRATGLLYMGARYYDPYIGRFLSVDPKAPNENDVHSLNRYSYGNNNPARFVDPDGHSPFDVGFLVLDVTKLAIAVYQGAGVSEAAIDVAFSVVGVASPVPATGQALKAAKIAAQTINAGQESVRAARGAAALGGRGFESFSALKRALGPAGPGQHWHHIVEQTPGNLDRFGAQSVHNTQNVVRLDAGVHQQISGYYSSIQPFTNGQTVRQWLGTQPFSEQAQFGLDTLRRFGVGP